MRYRGRIAATISDETSVIRLTAPSASTVAATRVVRDAGAVAGVAGLSTVDRYTLPRSRLGGSGRPFGRGAHRWGQFQTSVIGDRAAAPLMPGRPYAPSIVRRTV